MIATVYGMREEYYLLTALSSSIYFGPLTPETAIYYVRKTLLESQYGQVFYIHDVIVFPNGTMLLQCADVVLEGEKLLKCRFLLKTLVDEYLTARQPEQAKPRFECGTPA